jgi:CheY-like chemotaxis protein
LNNINFNWPEEKVLIADDDIYSIILLEKIMNKIGVKVVVANNGLEAFELLKTDMEISVAILDILMPKLNGDEVVRNVNNYRRDIIYIAYTADVLRLNKKLCFELGFFSCLTKPVSPTKLLYTINEAILQREKLFRAL